MPKCLFYLRAENKQENISLKCNCLKVTRTLQLDCNSIEKSIDEYNCCYSEENTHTQKDFKETTEIRENIQTYPNLKFYTRLSLVVTLPTHCPISLMQNG